MYHFPVPFCKGWATDTRVQHVCFLMFDPEVLDIHVLKRFLSCSDEGLVFLFLFIFF